MNFVNLRVNADAERVRAFLADNERVNENVVFDERHGKPFMHVSFRDGGRVRVKCELTGRATRDNGYLFGTVFYGRLMEKDGGTVLRGITLTSPILHLVWLLLIGFFVYRCFALGGFNMIPVCCVVVALFLFKDEYRKQGMIKRYLIRGMRRAGAKNP